ncbi:MAG: BlaI family transcriptional regulator [Planctomycetota bacterium]|nr:MAG: BlaI family transcriptional regulator [Planctomycetota bacterium]
MNLSDAEWKVMQVLWSEQPATARVLLDALGSDTEWAYSTLKTLLARLVEKGAVSARTEGRQRVYSAKLKKQRARKTALSGLLGKAFDGHWGNLFHHVIEEQKLSAADRERLREMLRALEDDDDT